jgi:hypothetical protein
MVEPVWNLAEHEGREGFAALEADWRRLYADVPSTATRYSYEAFSVFLDNLCAAPDGIRYFALSDGERVRAILPIEERRERVFKQGRVGVLVRVWGMPWHEGWWITDAIGPEDDARRVLLPLVIDRLRKDPARPAVLVLGRMRDRSVLWDGIDGLPPWSRYDVPDGAEYFFTADVPVDEMLAGMSRKARSVLRAAARRFEALDGAEYRRTIDRDDALAEYEDFLEVEASGWKGSRGSAIRQFTSLNAYYRGLIEALSADGRVEIHSLHAEGRCIAASFCVYTRNKCEVFKSGYDESYARVSPGRLNNHVILERCFADPDVQIVSEISDAPWLLPWSPHANGIRRAYVSLRPVAGPLLMLALRIRFGPVRRVVRMIKAWRRDRDIAKHGSRGRDAVVLD